MANWKNDRSASQSLQRSALIRQSPEAGVAGQNGQLEQPIGLSETGEGRARGVKERLRPLQTRTRLGLQPFTLSTPKFSIPWLLAGRLACGLRVEGGRRRRQLNPPDRPSQWQRAGRPARNRGNNPFGKKSISPFRDRKHATHIVDHNRLIGDHIVGLHGRGFSPSEEGTASRVCC